MKKYSPVITFTLMILSVIAAPVLAVQTDQTISSTQIQKQLAAGATSYIVVMEAMPVLAYQGNISGFAATKPAKGQKLNANSSEVINYIQYLETQRAAVVAAAGIPPTSVLNRYNYALYGFSAIMTQDQADNLANRSGIRKVMLDEMQYPQTDNTPSFLGLTDRGGAWSSGYTGEGVVIGVIDTGIWPEHDSFADDGSYKKPPITIDECIYGNTAHNPNDAPFTCNNKLIGARQILPTYRAIIGAESFEYDSARDDDGHGTHTASTAGGNRGVDADIFGIDRGNISGVAPRAHIVAYKALGHLGGYTSDLTAAIDQAVLDGVDVINYSIGGGASLTDPDDIAYLFAADAGVFVATSAGNSGAGNQTIGGPGSVPWITTVGASTHDRTFLGSAVLGSGDQFFGDSIGPTVGPLPIVDAADLGNELCSPTTPFAEPVNNKIVLCLRGNLARVDKSKAVFEAGGAGMILYSFNDFQDTVAENNFVPTVQLNNTDGLAIKDYIDTAGASASATINSGVFTEIDAPWMASFSSRGPNPVAQDIIKPDITAPGVNVLAGNTPTPSRGVPGQLFQAISGTSMSSPHVAGIFALLKQAHPDWSPAMAKSAIMTTAYQDVKDYDGTTPANPLEMGAGHLNPGGVNTPGSIFNPGIVYDAGVNEYAAFTCGANLKLYTPAQCDSLISLGYPTDASDLNLPSIGIAELSGSQTVIRRVTSVAQPRNIFNVTGNPPNTDVVVTVLTNEYRTFKASVDAPPGVSVEVTPSSFQIKPGETATYEVTFTNESATPGEWSYGSLTWKDDYYSVRSNIAVRIIPK